MKRLIWLVALGLLAAPALADAPAGMPLFVIIYKQGPAWKSGVPMKQQDAIGPHYRYMKKLFEEGAVLDAGPTLDVPGGMVILKAADLDAATAAMRADPSVTSGMFVGEVHSWAPSFRSAAPLPAALESGGPRRSVQDNVVRSSADPAVQIELPRSAAFVGSDSWVLQAYADSIMLYAFADSDAARGIQRLYWVQFEAYLPSHPEYHHTYDSTRHATMGGLDFLVDTWAESENAQDDADSDSAHLKALLSAKGYRLPSSMVSVRFVHLMEGARKELMFIYSEPAPDGLTATDLKKGGKAYARWPDIEKGLIQRGQSSIELQPPPAGQ